ncbi:unnamed protein product [Acanthoscelides obtectus]|uniref:Uncharacterized protein n=1 Tax=Acanthoscelides obtectus TaxID=200917 RepID=A0A9P0Q0A5_ACAOB|nr:unnamed protein product [Acanthoscelides obtectus]CAK1687987.1 hypothetical protein AOBTE_LOCUS36499 [Acanthoscelides obtectus]
MASKPIKKYLLFTSFFSIQLCYFSYNYIEAQTDFVQYFYTPSWKTSGSLYEPSQPSVKSSRFIRTSLEKQRATRTRAVSVTKNLIFQITLEKWSTDGLELLQQED